MGRQRQRRDQPITCVGGVKIILEVYVCFDIVQRSLLSLNLSPSSLLRRAAFVVMLRAVCKENQRLKAVTCIEVLRGARPLL